MSYTSMLRRLGEERREGALSISRSCRSPSEVLDPDPSRATELRRAEKRSHAGR